MAIKAERSQQYCPLKNQSAFSYTSIKKLSMVPHIFFVTLPRGLAPKWINNGTAHGCQCNTDYNYTHVPDMTKAQTKVVHNLWGLVMCNAIYSIW